MSCEDCDEEQQCVVHMVLSKGKSVLQASLDDALTANYHQNIVVQPKRKRYIF